MRISSRLLLLVAIATGVPVLVLAAYFFQLRSVQIDTVRKELSALTQVLARQVATEIHSATEMVYALSQVSDVASSDARACTELLVNLNRHLPHYTGFYKIRPDGVTECMSRSVDRSRLPNLDTRSYFRAALNSEEIVVNNVRIGEISGRPILPISLAARDPGGAVKFVLVATLDLAESVGAIAGMGTIPDLTLMLVDEEGTVVTRHPQVDGLVGTSIVNLPILKTIRDEHPGASREQLDVDGVMKMWSTARLQEHAGARLILAAGIAKEEVLAGVNRKFIQALFVLTMVAALVIGMALFLSVHNIQRPIAKIMDFVRRIHSGDLDARIGGAHAGGEFGYLTTGLNGMASSLQKHVSEVVEARDQLFHAQKVQALGQLTGGVSHDLNNILTVIMGNIDIIRGAARSDPDLEMSASLVRRAAERGANLTRGLLAYSRKQALHPQPTDLNDVVRETDHLLRQAIGEQFVIKTILDAPIDLAFVDPAHVQSALINLALNARDAMPDGGTLTIETRNAYLDEEYAAHHSEVRRGHYVMLAVTDTGTGISDDIRDKIFEPFFTTKEPGKGTGLGLSTIYGFVKQTEGHVKVYSEKGLGTTVKMYFPRAPEGSQKSASSILEESVPLGRELVLVVEDDDMVRDNALNQLGSLGYTVLSARTAVEALTILTQRPNIDLLFTDVILPGGMNGRHLAEEACRGRPNLKVLFTSGYTENVIIHQGRVDRDVILLTKPYAKLELARMVRVALSATQPGQKDGGSKSG